MNQIGPVLEKKLFECFFTIYGHGGHLEFPIMTVLSIFCITTII